MATKAPWSSFYAIEQTSVTGQCAALGNATTLIDTGTAFTIETSIGDMAYNLTDGSSASIVSVDSAVQVTTTTLTGGTANTWALNDYYVIAGLQTPPRIQTAVSVGIEGARTGTTGKYRMALTNSPHIIPNSGTIEHLTTTGRAEPFTTMDFSQVVGEPATVSLEMPMTAYNLSYFLLLLLQNGCSEVAGATYNTFLAQVYTNSAPRYIGSVIRVMVDNLTSYTNVDTVSHILYGGICKSLTISGAQNDILKLTAEMVGSWAYAQTTTDLSTAGGHVPHMLIDNQPTANVAWSSLGFPSASPLKFQDLTTAAGVYATVLATPETRKVNFDKFSLTLTNDAIHRYYANSRIKSWILGRIKGIGSISVPWGDTNYGGNSPLLDFIGGTDFALRLFNSEIAETGAATVENTFDFLFNIRITESPIETDPEVASNLTFETVYDGTNAAIKAYVGYAKATLDRINNGA